MREIKYESNGPVCLTKCPYLYNIKVCSTSCVQCIFHSHHDDTNNIVFCRFRELSQRKEEEIPQVKKYEKRPDIVEAIQFTKDCYRDTIFNFLYHLDFELTNNILEIQYTRHKVNRMEYHTLIAQFGDWIVKDENRTLQIISDEEFKKRYKEI
jgi:hypothetical protein